MTDIGCGDAHNCALTGNSIVHSWGDNSAGMRAWEGGVGEGWEEKEVQKSLIYVKLLFWV